VTAITPRMLFVLTGVDVASKSVVADVTTRMSKMAYPRSFTATRIFKIDECTLRRKNPLALAPAKCARPLS
jgi:hypothetical protein